MKSLFKISLALCVIACFAFTLKPSAKKDVKKVYTIVLDAGHGGKDNGNLSNGVYEKNITLKIAEKIKKLNQNKKLRFYLTRDGDDFVSLSDRVKAINPLKPDLVISLHVNSSNNDEDEGVMLFLSDKNPDFKKTKKMAIGFASELVAANPNFSKFQTATANFMVLRDSKAPALMLELGYLNNSKDRNYINSDSGQTEIAQNILKALSGK